MRERWYDGCFSLKRRGTWLQPLKHISVVVLLLLLVLQVRLVVPGDVDGAMNAGRLPMLLHWEAGLDAAGSLAGLKLNITCTVSETQCSQPGLL